MRQIVVDVVVIVLHEKEPLLLILIYRCLYIHIIYIYIYNMCTCCVCVCLYTKKIEQRTQNASWQVLLRSAYHLEIRIRERNGSRERKKFIQIKKGSEWVSEWVRPTWVCMCFFRFLYMCVHLFLLLRHSRYFFYVLLLASSSS